MPRPKKPADLGLELQILHPDSFDDSAQKSAEYLREHVDKDGHYLSFKMEEMAGQALAYVSVHGVGAGRHRELRGGRPDKRIKQNGDGCKRLRRVD